MYVSYVLVLEVVAYIELTNHKKVYISVRERNMV